MKVEFRSSFLRDIKKIKSPQVKNLIKKVIIQCETAKTITDIPNCEPLKSKGKFFKIKYPGYRFGIYINQGNIEFLKFGTRQNFYNDFPPF